MDGDYIMKAMVLTEKFIVKCLEENGYEIHKDKTFSYEIYDDSDKMLDKKYLRQIIESKDPYAEFNEIIYNIYDDCGCIDDILDLICLYYPEKYKEYDDEIRDWICEHICIKYPIDDYLNCKYPVDIIIDTGDENYDYVLNCVYPHYNGCADDKIENEASLLWLAKANGYSNKQLKDARKKENFGNSRFLESVYEEILNCTSHMNALVFLVEMSLKDIIDFHSQKNIKNIEISKETKTGLYDCWNGAGSLLEIVLEKDIAIPKKYISTCWPDKMRGYGIADIYGVNEEFWQKGGIKKVRSN